MAEARTDDRAPASPNQAILDANLTSLRRLLPQSAERIRTSVPPESTRSTLGRDGAPTYAWTDETGRLRWLGRTSMPSVSSAALVDAFQDGGRNVLLVGLAEGSEAKRLLDRLGPHQAVMIIEEDAWAAGLVMRLHDFSEAIAAGRMPVFVGPTAWDDLGQFLLDRTGYLMPERILSWPWLDAKAVADLSAKLLELGRRVAHHRAERLAGLRKDRPAPPTAAGRTIALISNVTQPHIRKLADRLADAAKQLGWSITRLVLDDPATVHPLAAEEKLLAAPPALHVLLDTAPQSLQYQLPPAAMAVICAHRMSLAAEWLKSLPATVPFFVTTEAQRRQAIETGRQEQQVHVLHPAASFSSIAGRRMENRKRVLVLADGADSSAGGVGLHLASHCQLWETAAKILEERCDSYNDEKAGEILAAAEKRLRIKLDSDEVRGGLVQRIRQTLGPAVVHQAYCTALLQAGAKLDLRGEQWPAGSVLSGDWRGPWPAPQGVTEALKEVGAVVSLRLGGELDPALMDCIADGVAAFVRSHPSDDASLAIIAPEEHVWRFNTRAELVRLVTGWQRHPEEFTARAEAAARHVTAHYTWARRLESILQSCGVR